MKLCISTLPLVAMLIPTCMLRMVVLGMVTWPEPTDVRRATIAIIAFVLLLGLVIWLLDVVLQQVLVKLIPSLFSGR